MVVVVNTSVMRGDRSKVYTIIMDPDLHKDLQRVSLAQVPIEEEHLGPVTRTHVRNEGFDIRQKSYAFKRSMKLSVCKVCYNIIDIDGFDDIINMNIDGKLQEVTRIRKL